MIQSMLAFGLGPQEILLLAVIVLLFFGGTKIPQLMRGLGRGMGEFQEGIREGKRNLDMAMRTDDDGTARTTEPRTTEPENTKQANA